MAKIIQEINLEVAKPNLFQAIVAKQTDYGSRYLKATLVNNGTKIFVDPSFSATINAKRPDGLSKRFDAEVNEDGTITAPLTGWMLEKSGIVDCDISIITTDAQLSSTVFSITVNEAACSGEVIEQDEDLKILTELINEVNTLTEELETKVANGEFKGEKGDPGETPDLTDYIKNGETVEIGIFTNKAEDITASTEPEEIITAWETDKFSLAQGLGNIVAGYDNLSLGEKGSIALGRQTKAINSYAFTSGLKTQAKGFCSRAGGSNTVAEADYTIADGFFAEAIGGHSIADGYSVKAIGSCSRAVNRENTAKGENSFVCGRLNVAEGANTFVAGSNSVAQGSGSFVGGTNIQESGNCNAGFNANNVIKGQFSAVLGRRNEIGVNAYQGIVTGNSCKLGADGSQSRNTFVGGQSSESTLANDSFVYGNGLKLNKQVWGWAVFGGYNDPGSSAALAVGNGKSDETRSNAFEVYSSGLVKTPNAPAPTDDYHLTTKKYVDEKVNIKKTVTLTSIEAKEDSNVNFPVKFDANKKYNVMMQFCAIDGTGEAIYCTKYLEGASFVDDVYLPQMKTLNVDYEDSTDEYFCGVHINLDMFYDETKDETGNVIGPGGKEGWVWVATEYPSGDYKHKYTLTITEA